MRVQIISTPEANAILRNSHLVKSKSVNLARHQPVFEAFRDFLDLAEVDEKGFAPMLFVLFGGSE